MGSRASEAKKQFLAKQRRERFARRLQFCLFDKTVGLRLDANGRPLPCSNCRIPARECAWEAFCRYCLVTFEHERQREAGKPEWQKRLCSPDSTLPQRVRCARCREAEPSEISTTFCQQCLDDIAQRAARVNLSLDLTSRS